MSWSPCSSSTSIPLRNSSTSKGAVSQSMPISAPIRRASSGVKLFRLDTFGLLDRHVAVFELSVRVLDPALGRGQRSELGFGGGLLLLRLQLPLLADALLALHLREGLLLLCGHWPRPLLSGLSLAGARDGFSTCRSRSAAR